MKCYSRVLHPTWANAVADHWKPFEVQKYAGCNRNAMKFATDDSDGEKVVIIGAKEKMRSRQLQRLFSGEKTSVPTTCSNSSTPCQLV